MRLRLLVWLAVVLQGLLGVPGWAQGVGETAQAIHDGKRPRLVVTVSIDQFRVDYLRRLTDLYLPAKLPGGKVGGFRYLMTAGSDFLDARYKHFPLYTGPGHAVILTGAYPYKTGIVSNNWWDYESNHDRYCVDDDRFAVVGALPTSKATPMGPRNLQVSTVGDELKLATAGRAKVVSIALKDRAAILMGGHMQNVCLWFDTAGGRWISSTAYAHEGKLPDWAEAVNHEAIPDKMLGQTWKPLLSPEVLAARSFSPKLPAGVNPGGIGLNFPHTVGAEKVAANYESFTFTPAANAYVFETAKRAIAAERLGQRDVSDLLTLNLSTNDYVAHAFGPFSPESVDLAVQTDHLLSDFLNFLEKTIPGGLKEVLFVVTADHGGAPVPEDAELKDIVPMSEARYSSTQIGATIQKALTARYGEGTWIATSTDGKENGAFIENFVYLNDATIGQALESGKAKSRAEIQRTAADALEALKIPGIYAVYTRSQILARELPETEMAVHLANGCNPKLSGDLFIINSPFHQSTRYATTHGTPFVYDTHVPLILCGFGIRPGVWAENVSPADLAPTLSILLGIAYPSGSDGVLLKSALR